MVSPIQSCIRGKIDEFQRNLSGLDIGSSSCRPRSFPSWANCCAAVRALGPLPRRGPTPQGPDNRTLSPGPLSKLTVTSGEPEKYVFLAAAAAAPRAAQPCAHGREGAPGVVIKKMWEQGVLGWLSVSECHGCQAQTSLYKKGL